jgi:hypothetical protein
VHAHIVRDLPAYVEHGGLAAARAEKRKHVDRPVDRPFDVLVDQRREVLLLALIDRVMQGARKTPETVLCHGCHLKPDLQDSKRPSGRQRRRRALNAAFPTN